jgi:hypothetical protein
MPLEVLIPLVIVGSALPLGFFLVRSAGHDTIFTRLGTYRRQSSPGAYWFWTVYHWTGLVFIALVLVATTIGLLFS